MCYSKRYLWIDDFDDGQNRLGMEGKLCNLARIEPGEVTFIERFEDALRTFFSDNFNYDTVILDIDLPAPSEEELNQDLSVCLFNHIDAGKYMNLIGTDESKPKNQAGLILYILLLKIAKVPINRICFCSANIFETKIPVLESLEDYEKDPNKCRQKYLDWRRKIKNGIPNDICEWKKEDILNDYHNVYSEYIKKEGKLVDRFSKKFIYGFKDFGLCPPAYFEKITTGVYNPLLVDFINEDKDYYDARMLVIQSCDYWVNRLKENNILPFDELYNLTDDKQRFKNMLEQIKMMFPVIKPDDPEKVYYQAMHVISMFHEEKAKIQSINGKKKLYPYHQMIRNFRNWSSHNKFENHQLPAEQFAFLLCVAFRTYFDYQKHEKEKNQCEYYLSDTIHYYEEVYFANIEPIDWNNDKQKVNGLINRYWETMIKEVKFYGGRIGQESLVKDVELSSLLQRLGEQDFGMPFAYINLSMFNSPFKKNTKHQITEGKLTVDDKIVITIEYEGEKTDITDSLFRNGQENSNKANDFFEKIAFTLLEDYKRRKS